ncbi:MAG TPA: MFS transporter [Acidimicrobiales bacterium]|nr:MFS transporter [Acidimicrobiales bacterium]
MADIDAGPGSDAVTPSDPPSRRSPVREVLALPSFRRYWISQLLIALVNGTLRFVLVWLVLDLTDWTPAVGLVGLALGIPALVVSLPAGALSDRVDRIRLVVVGDVVTAVALAALAVTVWTDVATPAIVAVVAAVVGTSFGMISPALQAVVPALVPAHRLMTGVGLQGMGMNIAMLTGSVLGGGAIALAGTGGALALLATIAAIAAVGLAGVRLPERAVVAVRRRVVADIADGVRFAVGREPLRSMLLVGFVASGSWGVVQLLLPDVVKSDLGQGAFTTSLMFGALGAGMLVTTVTLANRDSLARRGWWIAVPFSGFSGTMVVLMGWSSIYAITLAAMLWWGLSGGVVMTLQRTVLQESTPDEYMGRVMGANALAMTGSYPVAAGAAALAASAFGGAGAMMVLGAVVTVAAAAVTWRPAVLRA